MKESPPDERLTRRKAQLRRANARAKARQAEAIRTGEAETRGDLGMRMARRQARIKDATGRDRKDAKARALLYYWGGPCKVCDEHRPAVRYTSNCDCLNCRIDARAEAATAPDETAARRRAYRAAEYARRKEKRAQAKAAQLAHVPDGMTSPMAQLLGTILSTDG